MELNSLDIGGNPIPPCLGNRNDSFVPFMPSLTFFISKNILYKPLKVYKIFDLEQGHFSNHTGLYSDSAKLVNSFMEFYFDSRIFK